MMSKAMLIAAISLALVVTLAQAQGNDAARSGEFEFSFGNNTVQVLLERYDEDASGTLNEDEVHELMISMGLALEEEHCHGDEHHDDHDDRSSIAAARSADDHGSDHDINPADLNLCPHADEVIESYDVNNSTDLDSAELEDAVAGLTLALTSPCLLKAGGGEESAAISAAVGNSIAASVVLSLLSLLGAIAVYFDSSVSTGNEKNSVLMNGLISFAVGAMLGDVLLHVLPEMLGSHSHGGADEAVVAGPAGAHSDEEGAVPAHLMPMSVLIGTFLAFHVVHSGFVSFSENWGKKEEGGMKVYGNADELEGGQEVKPLPDKHEHPTGWLCVVADTVCNFTDGVAVGASFAVSTALGLATTIAVIAHEIPQELGDLSFMLRVGFSFRKAILLNIASGGAAIVGAVIGALLGSSSTAAQTILLAIVAASLLYNALMLQMPTLRFEHRPKWLAINTLASLAGVGVLVFILLVLEADHDH